MAEEIEISNVGDGGVASEATLKSLVAAVEKMAGGGDKGAKAAAKTQELHNKAVKSGITVSTKNRDALKNNTKSVKKATAATNKFANAMKGAMLGAVGAVANSMVGLGAELLSGGNRITDFTQHLPIVGSLFAPLGGFLEESLDSFRQVSDVGAGLGNSMMEVAQAAADTGMSLSEFSSFVKQNADALQAFGGGASGGLREFQRLSKQLRSGVGADLFNLGFTIQDMNEGLVTMAAIQARQIGVDRLNSRNLTNSTADYLTELDKLSRLTGKSREQMASQMEQNSRDMRVRVAEAQMDEDQRMAFRTNLAAAGAQSDRFAEVLRDMADGRPDEEVSKRLYTQSETFRRFAGEIENLSPEEMQQFMVDVNREVEAFGLQMGEGVSALDDAHQEMFAISGDLSTLQQMTAEERAAALAEQGERDKITDAMSDFEKAIADIRSKILSSLIDSGVFDAVGTSLNGFKELFESEEFKTALSTLATTIGEVTASVMTAINDFMADVQNLGLMEAFRQLFDGIDFGQMVKDFLFGGSGPDNSEQIEQKNQQLTELGTEAGDLNVAAMGGDEDAIARLEEVHAQMAQIRAERDALREEDGGGDGIFGSVFGDLSILETGAATVAGLLGAGGAVYLAISGLKSLVRGFGNPQVAAGAAVFTGMLIGTGASIKLAGDGISAAGDGIKKVAEGVEQLGSIQDTANFETIADSLGKIGPALISLTAGGVLESITSFFGADSPFEKLRDGINEFGDIDPTSIANLRTAGEGLNVFTSLTDTLDEGPINRYAEAIENLAESMERLNEALADKNNDWGETGVSAGSLAGEGGLFGGSGMSEEKINELNNTMMQAVAALSEIRQINTRQLTALREIGNVV